MTFFTEMQLLLKAEFVLMSNVCNILGYLDWIIDLLVLEKILGKSLPYMGIAANFVM